MDDLLMLAGELVENNNYQKNNFQEETKPDGDYEVVIESIKLKQSESTGTEWFGFTLKVVDGEFIEEKFYVNLFLTEKTIKATLSKIMRLIASMGYEIDLAMFNDKETIAEGLQTLVGGSTILSKSTSKNGFINYSFKGGEE
jgi:hypothetical protein